ncbi:MAG: hypothetical protein HN833_00320 [Elusimicrobiaceae bacterium]|jgi:parvulin-like peptidyl-prolyl isomerase|nr:hypothetical protein [Elusimicrobiaceae bacterium]MBT4008208.1 hypothetical protein [Elusimicrobiaceae bacterium]MBT5986945.1 hypothetical protein [Elusimicrobiaceae bacterium]MBT6715637.1 hypothetical protein [Elusimicrobiaceae bacterium]MBT7282838.1 hypothetical protein [Elusimicrobiaceae bacterium]
MNKKLNKIIISIICLLMVGIFADAKIFNSTIATVNGKPILSSDYEKLMTSVLKEYNSQSAEVVKDPKNRQFVEYQVLMEMVTEELLYQQAQAEKVIVKDSELTKAVDQIKQTFAFDQKTGKPLSAKKTEAAFKSELKKEAISYKEFQKRVKRQLTTKKLIDQVIARDSKPPKEKDIKQLYADIKNVMAQDTVAIEKMGEVRLQRALPLANKLHQLTAENAKLGHIFLKAEKGNDKETKAAIKKATDIRNQIVTGRITFTDAALKYTEDVNAQKLSDRPGNTDILVLKGTMPKDFEKQAFSLPLGKVSTPIKTDFGVHLITVKERKAKQDITYDMIEPELNKYLSAMNMQKAAEDYVKNLHAKATIDIKKKFDLIEAKKPEEKKDEEPKDEKSKEKKGEKK